MARGWQPALALLLLLGLPRPGAAQRHVGVLLDGPSPLNDSLRAGFVREIEAFFGAERPIDFPARHSLAADWTPMGVNAALDRLLADPDVDLVLALGPIGSNELVRRKTLPKPAIAALIVDAAVQDVHAQNGTSGVRNLSYIDVAYTTSRTLQLFHSIVAYRKLAVLVHPGLLAAIPQLRDRAASQVEALGAAILFVPVTTSAADALRAIPADVDAAYLTPLEQLPLPGLDSLISGLNVRRLPTFSYIGRREVARGTLVSYAPEDDLSRRARRVAGNIRRILNGENAGTLPVDLASVAQLTLNMATARAIGFSPDWITLTEADLLNEEAPDAGPSWSLARVGQEAVRVNLDLRAAERKVASGREDVRIARAALLPQIEAGATGTAIREATAAASLGRQAEREAQGSVSFSQVVYSDKSWANYSISRHTQRGRVADRRRTELDVVLQATTAYLDVLRTRAIARVERENLRLTRSNLDVAQLKERTGAGGLSDVYRWQAELAQSRRNVIDADARVQVAGLGLNAALNRPLEEPFRTEDAAADDPALITGEPRLFGYFANPATFAVFRDFMVVEGQAASPELQALDAALAAERRAGSAARRAFFLPTLTLQGSLSDVVSRGGAGATPPSIGGVTLSRPPDNTWSVRLQASLPLFAGFARTATLSQTNIEVDRLTTERQATALSVSQQIRAALHVAGAAWAGIRQAREAADAARKNRELVTDAYARGAVNIITLLDAQQSALSSEEAAANAVYDFLVDLMKVERAAGQFGFFRTPEERDAFVRRLDEFYRAAGVAPKRP